MKPVWLCFADGFCFWVEGLLGGEAFPSAAGEVRNRYVAPQTEGPGLKPLCKLNFFAGLKPCANPKNLR